MMPLCMSLMTMKRTMLLWRKYSGRKKPAAGAAKDKINVKCPVDELMFQNPYVSYKKTLTMDRMQTLFKDSGVNNASELIFQYIAHFFYRNIVPFDVVNS